MKSARVLFPHLAAALLVLPCCVSGSDDDDSEGASGDCSEELVSALGWFGDEPGGTLEGSIELGQTHVVGVQEERIAPLPVAERETLLLFTPESTLDPAADVRIAAFEDGALLGVLGLAPPQELPSSVESTYSSAALEPYSVTAWSAFLPWDWVREGVELHVGTRNAGTLLVHEHALSGLGAPHRFTISRSKIVLFGEPDFDTTTVPPSILARDFFAAVPAAELRWVDSTPWRLDELVVTTEEGPRLVASEDERLAITSAPDRWGILKHQFSLRMSLANTGRGLILTSPPDGDSSPYSFGTSVGLGWVRQADGSYADVNNAPYAAGWTGWSALWMGECGNVFIHEVGHSLTLAHFVEGTASAWGVEDEYPLDGTNLATHPWGFDTTRRQFRTWYRVGSDGPVTDEDGEWIGKRDPMNGGESPNSATCFPQYTAFHARQIQEWLQSSPTLAVVDGVPGVYRWDPDTSRYVEEGADPSHQDPAAVDVPVVTLIGTLGNDDAASQTYPPMFSASGNAFELPDPMDPELPSGFVGARWFLEITYGDGSVERALVARGSMAETTELALYSLNLQAELDPVQVDLYRASEAYPDLDVDSAELVHSRSIGEPSEPLPAVLTVGGPALGNGSLSLDLRCTPGLDCASRSASSSWRVAAPQLHFDAPDGSTPAPELCTSHGESSELVVPALLDGEAGSELVVHAQRTASSGGASVRVPIHDITPWFEAPDTEQGLLLWLPYELNASLAPGRYTVDGSYELAALLGEDALAQVPLLVDLTVHDVQEVDLGEQFESEGVSLPDSSVYYLVEDPAMGPNWSLWWGGGGPTPLSLPVIDEEGGSATTLSVDSWKKACGDLWELNTGQAADWGCSHSVLLQVSELGNEHLESGHVYRSPGSSPLVVRAVRWHQPGAGTTLATFAFEVVYTAP